LSIGRRLRIGGLLRLLGCPSRLLCRGRVALLCAQLRRGTQAGNQQRAQDARDSVLLDHKSLEELLVFVPNFIWI
jgi:hypothetical protein